MIMRRLGFAVVLAMIVLGVSVVYSPRAELATAAPPLSLEGLLGDDERLSDATDDDKDELYYQALRAIADRLLNFENQRDARIRGTVCPT